MQDRTHCKKSWMQITFYVSELTIMGNGQIDFSQSLGKISRTIVIHG